MPAPRHRLLGSALLLLLALVVAWWTALDGGFVYDDEPLLTSNPATRSLGAAAGSWDEPLWAFEDPSAPVKRPLWRPLTVGALSLGGALGGGDPFHHHLVSLLFHAVATLCAWRLAARLVGDGPFALGAGLLFAVHPVHVESVAWISAVNDPLQGACVLASLLAFERWRERDAGGAPVLAGTLLLAGLLAKESAVVAPLLAVVLDLARGRRPGVRAYAPYAVALVLWIVLRAVALGDPRAGLVGSGWGDLSLGFVRSLTYRLELVGGFLGLLAWPAELTVVRPVRLVAPLLDGAVLAGLGLGAVTALALVLAIRRRWRALAFGVAFALLAIAPIVLRYEAAGRYPLSERYLYLAAFGAAVAAVALARRLLPRPAALTLVAAAAVALAVRARAYVPTFADDLTFRTAAAESAPEDPYVQWGVGRAHLLEYERTLDKAHLERAHLHFLRSLAAGTDYGEYAVEDDPSRPMTERLARLERMVHETPAEARERDPAVFVTRDDRLQANLGQFYVFLAAARLAEPADYETPLTVAEGIAGTWPEDARAHAALGAARLARGELEEAEAAYREAVRLGPSDHLAWKGLARSLLRQGEPADARAALREGLRIRPDDVELAELLIAAALEDGQLAVAESAALELHRDRPDDRRAMFWRGKVAARSGRYPEALGWFDRALAADPQYGAALKEKGLVLLRMGERTAAMEAWSRAAEELPEDYEVHYQLAALLLDREPDHRDEAWARQVAPILLRAYMLAPPGESKLALQRELVPFVAGDPDQAFSLATSLERRGDGEQALFWLQKTIEAAPLWPEEARRRNLAQVHLRAGILYRGFGHVDDARDELERSVALDPRLFTARFELGELLLREGDFAAALEHLRVAKELLPDAGLGPELRPAVEATIDAYVGAAEQGLAAGPPPPGDGG